MSYDAAGKPSLEVARSIETTDNINYRITLKPGWKFTDGSPVTAHSFVDSWNYGALSSNAQLQQDFFSPIGGFDEVSGPQPTQRTMSGLRVVSDLEFSVRLKAPTIDFTLRLGHSVRFIRCRTPHFAIWRRLAATRSATVPTSWPTAPTVPRGNTTSRST
jgi:oligopeptide transport system substrate-binding protein